MNRILFSIVIFTFYSLSAVSQNLITKDTVAANHYYNLADSLIGNSYFEEAIKYCELAKQLYSKYNLYEKTYLAEESIIECLWRIGDYQLALDKSKTLLNVIQKNLPENHILEGRAYFKLGTVYYFRNETKLAIANFNKSLVIYSNNNSSVVTKLISNSHLNLGAVYYRLGQFDLAQKHFVKSMEIDKIVYGEDHLYIVDHYNNIGHINRNLGHFDVAMNYYSKGLLILNEINTDRLLIYSDILEGIGIVKTLTGELDNAKDYIFQSLKHRINIYGLSHPSLNYNYNSLGHIFFLKNDYDSSLFYYKKALLKQQKYNETLNSDISPIYEGMALTFLNKGNYDSAVYFQKKSISALQQSQHKGLLTPRSLYLMGYIHEFIKDDDLAEIYFIESVKLYNQYFSGSMPYLAEPYMGLAKIELRKGNYEQSLTYLQKGINCNMAIVKETGLSDKKYIDKILYLEVLIEKAETLLAKYKSENNRDDLLSSIKTYDLCLEVYNDIYYSFNKNDDKIQLQTKFSKLYAGSIESLEIAYTVFEDDHYLKKGFELFEKSKANIIKNALGHNVAKKFGGIPDSILFIESTIRKELIFYQKGLYEERYKNEEADSLKLNIFERKSFELSNRYDSLIKSLEQNYYKYFNLKYGQNTIAVEELQSLLRDDQILIEYSTDEERIYILKVSKSNIELKRLDRDSIFNDQLMNFKKLLSNPNLLGEQTNDYHQYLQTAYALYNSLLGEQLKTSEANKELIIIPDGELALIPFGALLTEETNRLEVDYATLPYLIRKHAISYAVSATLLFGEMQNINPSSVETNENVLAFAPKFDNDFSANASLEDPVKSKLAPLNWTVEEVNRLSFHFDSEVYKNAKATEKTFKLRAGNFNMIHIASHGMVDDENPMYSKIAFTADEIDSLNDGYLHTFELYNMQLNADMAVLSACNTGQGKVVLGEGVLSLARGFIYAGCRSVVMSLWVANDRSTATIMADFYQYLADGQTKNSALQKAKLDYIRNSDGIAAHPYYWSQFVISGNTNRISQSNHYQTVLYLAIASILSLLALLYLLYKRKLTNK